MLIKEKLGNLDVADTANKTVDWVDLEWFEADKRIMHKHTRSGTEVVMKFLNKGQQLTQGDILYEDAEIIIAVAILPCDVMVIHPKSMYEMACICYEIGNKHLPLFYEEQDILVVYDTPLFHVITAFGYEVQKAERKLLHPLKTSIAMHAHLSSDTVFSIEAQKS